MRQVLLGASGLRVSELCLGAMTFGNAASREESGRILAAFTGAGGNFIDTANNYAGGRSEEIVGELAAGDRDRLVIATKYTAGIRANDPNALGNHRKSLVQSLDQSLARLRTDYVDLLWVHVWDAVTPIEETLRALDGQVRAGKVLHIGFSDVPAWVVARANAIAEHRGLTPYSAIQIEYSLAERTVERELVPMAEALGLPVLAWGPLAGGLLTGKYADGETGAERRLDADDRRMTERGHEIARVCAEVAAEAGATPGQVALRWLLERPGPHVIPIVGARSAEQLTESLGSLEVRLSGEQIDRLDAASAIPMGFPHEMLERLGVLAGAAALRGRHAR